MTLPFALDRGAGSLVGGILMLGLLIGIVLNVLAMRRRRTNAKCALGAIFALSGGLVAAVGTIAVRIFAIPSPASAIPGLIGFVALIVAVTLAIAGLVEIARFPGLFDRGRNRAIATLALPVILAGSFVAAVCAGFHDFSFFAGPNPAGTAAKTLVNEVWNFRIDAPAPWASIEPSKLNPLACAAFTRQAPPLFSIVLAEDLTRAGGIRLDAAVQLVKKNLADSGSAEFLEEASWDQNGLAGRRLESVVTAAGATRFFYVHWLAQSGGAFYQIVTWGPPEAREQIRVESRRFVDSFHLLDPKRSLLAETERAPATFSSPHFGYAVDLTNTVWVRRWPDLAQDNSYAEFGAMNAPATARFCVIPVWIGDDNLDLDALTRSLAARVGVPFPHQSVFAVRTLGQGPVRGRAFACEVARDGASLLYRLRVLRGRGFAYLLAAWMDKKGEAASEFLDIALDCVSFPEKIEPDPLILGERSRGAHSTVWNDIGVALFQADRAEAALPWFRRAFEVNRTNAAPLANFADACLKAGRPADALAFLDQHLADFRGNYQLSARRASAQFQTGDAEGALASYAALFDSGWRDDDAFSAYIRELIARHRSAAALTALDRYAQGRDTFAKLRAEVLQARGKRD